MNKNGKIDVGTAHRTVSAVGGVMKIALILNAGISLLVGLFAAAASERGCEGCPFAALTGFLIVWLLSFVVCTLCTIFIIREAAQIAYEHLWQDAGEEKEPPEEVVHKLSFADASGRGRYDVYGLKLSHKQLASMDAWRRLALSGALSRRNVLNETRLTRSEYDAMIQQFVAAGIVRMDTSGTQLTRKGETFFREHVGRDGMGSPGNEEE